MRDLTDRPFGVNIAQAFVRDASIAEFVIDQGVQFVTTSAGSPTKYTSVLKAAGLTVYHVVPTLATALKAVDAGVDGLVVEGGEGGGFKSPTPVSTMVLLPARAVACRRADHRRRRDHRRDDDGGRVRARCRGRADGDAHGVGRRVTGARQLEERDHRRRRDRHAVPERTSLAGVAGVAHRAVRAARARRAQRVRRVRQRQGALLRRRHERRDRALGSGRRPDRRDPPGRRHHRRHRPRVRRDRRPAAGWRGRRAG